MSKEISLPKTEILEPTQTVVKANRMDQDTFGVFIQAGSAAGIAGMVSFAIGTPIDFVVGVLAVTGLLSVQIQNFFALKTQSGDYIEMISRRRSEITKGELLRAWSFLPGRGSKRLLEEFLVDEKDGSLQKTLRSGLVYAPKHSDESHATHRVSHEIKSSWRGIEIIQTIKPLDPYLWEHALEDVTSLYEISGFDSTKEIEGLKGTAKDRLRDIERITTKEQ